MPFRNVSGSAYSLTTAYATSAPPGDDRHARVRHGLAPRRDTTLRKQLRRPRGRPACSSHPPGASQPRMASKVPLESLDFRVPMASAADTVGPEHAGLVPGGRTHNGANRYIPQQPTLENHISRRRLARREHVQRWHPGCRPPSMAVAGIDGPQHQGRPPRKSQAEFARSRLLFALRVALPPRPPDWRLLSGSCASDRGLPPASFPRHLAAPQLPFGWEFLTPRSPEERHLHVTRHAWRTTHDPGGNATGVLSESHGAGR